jgi:hypothetical protein
MYNAKLKEVRRKVTEKGGHRNRATPAVARKLVAYLMAADRAFFASQPKDDDGADSPAGQGDSVPV